MTTVMMIRLQSLTWIYVCSSVAGSCSNHYLIPSRSSTWSLFTTGIYPLLLNNRITLSFRNPISSVIKYRDRGKMREPDHFTPFHFPFLQILSVDLACEMPPSVSLAYEQPERDIMRTPPRRNAKVTPFPSSPSNPFPFS